jgi:methanogen homocitrate synthase
MSKKPWIGPKWFVSPYNFAPEARASFEIPEKVYIYDVTLRDGEQCPGIVFRKEDKIKIAQALDELGVHRLEAGMPAVSQEDFESVKEIAHLGLKSKVKAFSRALKSDIDLALKADVWGITVELPSSQRLIETGYKWTPDKVMKMAVEASLYAKSHGLHVSFFCIDSTRAELDFLRKLCTTVVDEGKADALVIVDTFGVANPLGFQHLIKNVRKWVKAPIEVHVHNDLGLATANSVAGVTAGAQVIHTNINGLGERSGGASLEETAMVLRLLYGVELDLNFSKLTALSRLLEKISGVPNSPMKPVVGTNSFSYEAGIAVMFCYRFMKEGFLQGGLPYLPEFVGNEFKITLGKKSGSYSVLWELEKLGWTATDEQIDEILKKVKEEAIKTKKAVSQQKFKEIAEKVLKQK